MQLMDIIYQRKSIRKYAAQKLDANILEEIRSMTSLVDRLYDHIGFKVHLVEEGEKIQKIMSGIIGSYGKIVAPHYLVITSEEQDGYFENVGYGVEQIVLALTSMGIGTCWIGGHVKKELLYGMIDIPENHKPVVLVSFGYPEDSDTFSRKNPSEAKRKEIKEILNGDVNETWHKIIDAARMAPSAANSQPWRFVAVDRVIHVYQINQSNFLMKKFLEKINRLDMGIALSHIQIAASFMQKKVSFVRMGAPNYKNYNYIVSVVEKNPQE